MKRLADEVAHHNATVIQARQLAAEEEQALLLKKQQLEEELHKAQELYRETAEAADVIRRMADGKVSERDLLVIVQTLCMTHTFSSTTLSRLTHPIV